MGSGKTRERATPLETGGSRPRRVRVDHTPPPTPLGVAPGESVPAIWTPPSRQGFHPGRVRPAPTTSARRAGVRIPNVLRGGENEDMWRGIDCGPISGLLVETASPGHHDSRTPRAIPGNGVRCAGREISAWCGVGRFEAPCHSFELSAVVAVGANYAATYATSRVQTAQTSRASLLATATRALLK